MAAGTRRVLIGLGSNRGDRKKIMRQALHEIEARGLGRVLLKSSLWATEPVGLGDPAPFLNAAALLETDLGPDHLLAGLLAVEAALGRERPPSPTPLPRTIDLDLLLIGEEQYQSPTLTVPHPRLHLRRFVLAPLAEIAPEARHPALGCTVAELLARLNDPAHAVRTGLEWDAP